jgi:hypothetical protein
MSYRLLADLILVLHLLFVLFAVFGGLLCLHRRAWAWVHIPTVLWAAWVELSGWICPLTPLENHYRTLAGGEGFRGGFVEHYLLPVLYPADLTRTVQIALGLSVVVINYGIYKYVWHRRSVGSKTG